MTDEQQKLSDRFRQAHMTLQCFYAEYEDDVSPYLNSKRIKEAADTMIDLYNEWRTYIKDPISLDPKLFAAELHHLADKIERGELKL